MKLTLTLTICEEVKDLDTVGMCVLIAVILVLILLDSLSFQLSVNLGAEEICGKNQLNTRIVNCVSGDGI